MRAGRYTIIFALLVLVASFVKGSHHYAFKGLAGDHPGIHAEHICQQHPSGSWHPASVLSQEQSSDQAKHKERRHSKSLVSQAIVAECPIGILPDFVYCHRSYSPFLPEGCTSQFTGNFSLRGPPAC
jgi:hypothetical protein